MEDTEHSNNETPRKSGFVAHPIKTTALALGAMALLLFIGLWLIGYVNLLSFEWNTSRSTHVLASGSGRISFSRWSIKSFSALAQVEEFHAGKTGKGPFPEIDIGGEYRQPRNAVQFLGTAVFYWLHGAESASIFLIPCWIPATILSVILLCALARGLSRRRRYKPGFCRKCGYDLRATPGRCPECGATKVVI